MTSKVKMGHIYRIFLNIFLKKIKIKDNYRRVNYNDPLTENSTNNSTTRYFRSQFIFSIFNEKMINFRKAKS